MEVSVRFHCMYMYVAAYICMSHSVNWAATFVGVREKEEEVLEKQKLFAHFLCFCMLSTDSQAWPSVCAMLYGCGWTRNVYDSLYPPPPPIPDVSYK